MQSHPYSRNYESPEGLVRSFPSVYFYWRLGCILYNAGRTANSRPYTADDWVGASEAVVQTLEYLGARFYLEGMENLSKVDGPCVIVSNHMSTMETFVLPCVVQPVRDVTFVVKESLLKYPCLGPVLRSRDPISVGRANPREDLAAVLDGGQRLLAAGRSIIIFPQGTRSDVVDVSQFSSLGVKLARKAGVPIVPLALKTNAWGSGSLIKDMGAIRPEIPIHFRFGDPVSINGNGKEEHAAIVQFIQQTFAGWTVNEKQDRVKA